MIDIGADLAVSLRAEVSRIATCWRISRRDGVVLGFTTHDQNIAYNGVNYSPAQSFQPSQIRSSSHLAVDTMDVEGVLSSDHITEADLRAGRFDDALIEVFLIDWSEPENGIVTVRSGRVGDIQRDDDQFVAELRGRKQDFQQPIGGVYSPECRAQLGDLQCRIALREFTRRGRVTQALAANQFAVDLIEADDWLHYGRLRWLTGHNAGIVTEVKSDHMQVLTLVEPMSDFIQVGDIFEVHAGCDKRFVTCRSKFFNQENFRGEPFVPGIDSIIEYPGLV